MNRPVLLRSAAATAVTLLALTACGSGVSDDGRDKDQDDTGNQDAGPVELTNCGRELSIAAVPGAAVGLSPSQTELLLRLGQGERMAGQAQTDTAPLPAELADQAAGIPVLSEGPPPSREILLNTEPDFVFAPTSYEFTAEQGFASLDQLDQAGAAAYIATGGCPDRRMTGTVDDLFTDLDNLGKIFDAEDRAAELATEARTTLDDVTTRTADREPPTVAQVYVEGNTLSAIGAGIEYDIIRRAGGDNVFGPDDAAFSDFFAAQINPEELARLNPRALVFTVHDEAHEQATRAYLTSTFPELDAVREDRLIPVSGSDVYPGTLGNVRAVADIARGLHPDAF
jgi:iron complex transport system substrate-binding protein